MCAVLARIDDRAQIPADRVEWTDATHARLAAAHGETIFARLGDLIADDATTAGEAAVAFDELPPRDQVDLARWGLWSEDVKIALGAAVVARARTLDVGELRRFAKIASPRCLTLKSPFDFDDFRDALVPDDLTRDLILTAPRPREPWQHLGAIHRVLRPRHAPLLAEATRSDDWFLRTDAMNCLSVVAIGSEANRDVIALAVLAWNPATAGDDGIDPTEELIPAKPLAIELETDTGGLPRTLCAVVQRLWSNEVEDQHLPARFRPWAVRWLLDAKPVTADLPLLRKLAAAEDPMARSAALCLFTRLPGAEVDADLRTASQDGDTGVAAIALAARARGGDGEALAALRERAAAGDAPAVAGLLTLEESGLDAIATLLCDGDEELGTRVARALVEAVEPSIAPWFGLRRDTARGLADRITEAKLSGPRLVTVLSGVADLRTRELCRRAIASLRAAELDHLLLAVLDVADHAALVERLRALSADESVASDQRLASRVAAARLAIGDREHGTELLALVDGEPDFQPTWLGRSASAELRTALTARLAAAASPTNPQALRDLAALAAVDGVDEQLTRAVCGELGERSNTAEVPAEVEAVVPAALHADAREAFATYLGGRPLDADVLDRCGSLAAPAVRSWLLAVRDSRELGRHMDAVAELAAMGDDAARAELHQALDLELYPWFDDLPAWALSIDTDRPDPLRWIDALAGNCCSFAALASRLEDWYEVDPFVSETGPRSRPAILREHFTRPREDWHWSPSVSRFVILH